MVIESGIAPSYWRDVDIEHGVSYTGVRITPPTIAMLVQDVWTPATPPSARRKLRTSSDSRPTYQLPQLPLSNYFFRSSRFVSSCSPVSGMANSEVSVATRNVPWTDIPTPPPITTPSHTDSSACSEEQEQLIRGGRGLTNAPRIRWCGV